MQSILEHEHSQFDRKFHYMEVLISDLWGPPSYYVILQGWGSDLSVQSIDFQKRSIHKTCVVTTEFTSSNNFIMWLERITLLSLQFCQTTADFEQAIEYNE